MTSTPRVTTAVILCWRSVIPSSVRHPFQRTRGDSRAIGCGVVFSLSLGLLLMVGCAHPRVASMPGMSLTLQLPPIQLAPVEAPAPRTTRPRPPLDFKWLDFDGFFPPGATRITSDRFASLQLCAERRTRFPTTELCNSPDENFVLFHDGMKRKNDIFHWLLLLKKEALFPNAIFCTGMAFDVSWSEASNRFAVTHYVGRNSSEVFVVCTADLIRRSVEVKPPLAPYFAESMLSAPMFSKAYRWTRDGQLIVRGIARSEQEPYDQIGFEVLAAFPDGDSDPQTTFLRGYVLPVQR